MLDQATKLRNLMLRASRQAAAVSGPAPQQIVMAGGKGGVGTSTLALNTAVALAQNGSRVVLVDANLHRADVSVLCGIEEEGSIADVLSARRDLHEVLQRGPAGVLVVPGVWAGQATCDYSEKAMRRLMDQLGSLGRHADIVILDVGAGASSFARRFWTTANRIILTTTPDSVAVMDSYATIKAMMPEGELPPLQLVVNRVESAQMAEDVWRRVDQSCHRFLNFQVGLLGHVCSDEHVMTAASTRVPVLIQASGCTAAEQIQNMASQLLVKKDKDAPPNNSAA